MTCGYDKEKLGIQRGHVIIDLKKKGKILSGIK
jgi:hypothetical protein